MSRRNPKPTRIVIVSLVVCIVLLCLFGLFIDQSRKARLSRQTRLQPFPGPGKLVLATWDTASSAWQVHQLEAGLPATLLFSFPVEADSTFRPLQYDTPFIVSPAGDMAVFAPGILVNLRTGEYDNLRLRYWSTGWLLPAFSPDGERLAFRREGGLWVRRLDPFTASSLQLIYKGPCDLYTVLAENPPEPSGAEPREVCVSVSGPVWLNADTLIFSHGTLKPVVQLSWGLFGSFPLDTISVMDYTGRVLHEFSQDVEEVLRGVYQLSYPEEQPSTPTLPGDFPGVRSLGRECMTSPDAASLACLVVSRYSKEAFDDDLPSLAIVDLPAETIRIVLRWDQDEFNKWHLVALK